MKTSAVLCAALAAAAIAQPHQHGNKKRHVHGKHQKRALVTEWVTETAYVTEYIDGTSTVWVGPSDTATPSVVPTTSVPAQFFEPASQPSYTTLSTSSTPAAPVVQQSIQQAPVVSSSSSSSSSSFSSSSSPSPSPAPVPETPAPQPAPQPATTSAYVAPIIPVVPVAPVVPITSTAPLAQPTTQPAAAPSSGSGSGSGSGSPAGPFTGKMTYYTLGTGSCGDNNAGDDMTENIVALSAGMMGDYVNGANGNYCHRNIKISLNGKSTTAYVTDKCPGCPQYGIDVSEKIFIDLMGSTDAGHADVSWEFV